MEKYVYNVMNNTNIEENNDTQRSGAHFSDTSSMRVQMRGFELIQKIFDLITVEDWTKIYRTLRGAKFQRAELVDIEFTSKIYEAV